MNLKAKITELAAAILPDERFFIVDVQVSNSRVKSKVTVLIDSDSGITIDECADLSRELGRQIEELNLFENAYTLEVSSPGTDFPLTQIRQFRKNVGRKVRLQLADGSDKIGVLESVTDEAVVLLEDPKKKVTEPVLPISIPYSELKKAQVLISFK
ncbi:MAG: ribosome maturation factor RimP [Siphonobacter sp.]